MLRHDHDNTPLALNQLDDIFSASSALVDQELYLRGEKFLYCIAEAARKVVSVGSNDCKRIVRLGAWIGSIWRQ